VRLRLTWICRAGDVFTVQTTLCRNRPESFHAIDTRSAAALLLLDYAVTSHKVISLVRGHSDVVSFKQSAKRQRWSAGTILRASWCINGL